MRLVPLLLVSLALVMAGCSKEDDSNGGGTTTPPTGNSTTTPPTTTTPGGNTTTPPTTSATPMELCNKSEKFTHPPSGATPPSVTVECGTPGAAYKMINATVTFETETPAPANPPIPVSSPKVDLVDSAGTSAGSCAGPTGPVQAPVTCEIAAAAIVPGAYSLVFSGTGNLKATVSVTVS